MVSPASTLYCLPPVWMIAYTPTASLGDPQTKEDSSLGVRGQPPGTVGRSAARPLEVEADPEVEARLRGGLEVCELAPVEVQRVAQEEELQPGAERGAPVHQMQAADRP